MLFFRRLNMTNKGFYSGDKFKQIISYLNQNPTEATLKEKNNQLLMRKENVQNVDEVNGVLVRILDFERNVSK